MIKRIQSAGIGVLLLGGAAWQPVSGQAAFNNSHSNYAGLGGAYWNPASLADNRYTLQLYLGGFDFHASTTAYQYTGPWRLLNPTVPMQLEKPYLTRNITPADKMMSMGFAVRGPGLMLRLNSRNTLAVSTRMRMAVQGNKVSSEMLGDAEDGFSSRKNSVGNTFNLNLNAFAEWNASYARVVLNEERHFLKAGLTVRHLSGIGAAYLQSRGIDYNVVPKSSGNGDSTLHITSLEGGFGYSNPDAFRDLDGNKAIEWAKNGGRAGQGWGGDIGLTYEYRPRYEEYEVAGRKGPKVDHSRNKYKVRISAAITDIGSIRYRTNAVAYDPITSSRLNISEEDTKNIGGGNFDTKIERFLQTWRYRKRTGFAAGLPTALNLDVDYHLWSRFYLNGAVSQGLRGNYAVGMRTFSYASLTPRFETKFLELAVPFSLINGYRSYTYGLSARIGPFGFGSNNLNALSGNRPVSGVNVYVEFLPLSIGNKRHKKSKSGNLKPATPLLPATPPPAPPAAAPMPQVPLEAKPEADPPTAPEPKPEPGAAAPALPEPSATPAADPTPAPPATPADQVSEPKPDQEQ